jgi:hypothetical protein
MQRYAVDYCSDDTPSETAFHASKMISISRYGVRYWAVYLNDELLAVTVYKKGALAIQEAFRVEGFRLKPTRRNQS